jgi:hypothetical protein
MAKVRRYVEYLDGTVRGVVVTAGDEERARRNGIKRTDDGYALQVLWYAAKRNGLPHTDSAGEEPMLDWLDHVARYDMYLTQGEADEQIALLPPEPPAGWEVALNALELRAKSAKGENAAETSKEYTSLYAVLEDYGRRLTRAEAIQRLVREDLGEA